MGWPADDLLHTSIICLAGGNAAIMTVTDSPGVVTLSYSWYQLDSFFLRNNVMNTTFTNIRPVKESVIVKEKLRCPHLVILFYFFKRVWLVNDEKF